MRINNSLNCDTFPCPDVNHAGCLIPNLEIDPERVSLVLISEAAPPDPADFYYAPGDPLFAQTTVQAFQDAGAEIQSMQDILDLGVYLTTAVKCSKTDYAIQTGTILTCSRLLEQELNQFPNVKAYLLMGDVAIKAVNAIAKRTGQPRVIPAGSSFFIEKSKRQMIAEDIRSALAVIRR